MQKLRLNLDHSRAILEWLQRRERRKRDILLCEMESQQMQLRMRHDPRVPPPQVRPPLPLSPKASHVRTCLHHQAAPAAAEPSKQLGALTLAEQPGQGGAAGRAATQQLMDAAQKREKRRRRDGRDRPRQTDHAFVPPPELPEPEMPFLCAPELEVRPRLSDPSSISLIRLPHPSPLTRLADAWLSASGRGARAVRPRALRPGRAACDRRGGSAHARAHPDQGQAAQSGAIHRAAGSGGGGGDGELKRV